MNKWLKIILLIVQIGGGLLGFYVIGRVFLTEKMTPIQVLICATFAIVFAFGILAGIALIKKPRLGLILSLIFQAIQIPIIITPVVSYILSSGVYVNYLWHETGWKVEYALLGSRFYFYLNSNEPRCTGVNILALVLFVFLIREIWFNAAAMKISKPKSSNIPDQQLLSASWRGR